MKIVQINVTASSGSTGRIIQDIGSKVVHSGNLSLIAYGRGKLSSENGFKVGNSVNQMAHVIQTRLFDNHGFASDNPTKKLIKWIESNNPDIIHLHNLHGYYVNIEILFEFLSKFKKQVIWTLHDCWAFTGHCTYFTHISCERWKSECHDCPLKNMYPASFFLDSSRENFKKKRSLISGLPQLTLVTVSDWLGSLLSDSFLRDKRTVTIYNGIDLSIFSPKVPKKLPTVIKKPYVLGVANIWTIRKGLQDFFKLRELLTKDIEIVLIGLDKKQISSLPEGIIGLERQGDLQTLAAFYANAQVFVNPSILETFGMVTAEALACGTPVVVYDATASPELVKSGTGYVVPKHDIYALERAISKVIIRGKDLYATKCREVAIELFDNEKQYNKYLDLYKSLTRTSNEE